MMYLSNTMQEGLQEVNIGEILYTVIIVLLLLFLLRGHIKKGIDMLGQMRDHIELEISSSEKANIEAQQKLSEANNVLSEAEEEKRVILSAAEQKSLEQAEVILNNSKQESQRMKELALEDIRNEKEQMLVDFQKDIVDIAYNMANKAVDVSESSVEFKDNFNFIEDIDLSDDNEK